ncbi:protein containing Glycosyl transferase, family 2 domain protein, partial [gut metagenome]
MELLIYIGQGNKHNSKIYFKKTNYVPVTIVVPAYNEELTVVDTVRSLLTLDYTTYEIVVVDDGSKDQTSKSLID